MTEAEWLACTDPTLMLEFLRGKASDRKFRLFSAACCRAIWHRMTDAHSRAAVERAELFVDGQASGEQLEEARIAAGHKFLEWQAATHDRLEAWHSGQAVLAAMWTALRDEEGEPVDPADIAINVQIAV